MAACGVPHRVDALVDGHRLAGQCCLRELEAGHLGEAEVRRDQPARLEEHDVPDDEVGRGDVRRRTVTDHPGLRRRHRVQRLDRLLGAERLDHADGRVEHDDDDDGDGVDGLAHEAGDDGGRDEQQDHDVLDLLDHQLEKPSTAVLGQHVRPVLGEPAGGLGPVQPGVRVDPDPLRPPPSP